MQDDEDEFGDLYGDVLLPLATVSDIPYTAPHSNSDATHLSTNQITSPYRHESTRAAVEEEPDDGGRVRDGVSGSVAKSEDRALPDSNKELVAAIDAESVDLVDKEVKFDIEDNDDDGGGGGGEVGEVGSELVIPGLLYDGSGGDGGGGVGGVGEGDDWDSDSDDDLKIVLNDNNHMAAMERGGMIDDNDNNDGGGLVILADGDLNHGVEEQEWVENAALPVDGERKDEGEPVKTAFSGGMIVAPKVGYSGHGYHSFRPHFKYVRPGAASIPGAATSAPGGPPGQIRPLVNMAGRGRGEWRPPGIQGTSMQKVFHAGPGLPGWGNSVAGRGFGGGLEFTLPSHKTIFDVEIESFEEKPWKYPNVDASDFFNFGLNEDSWKDYCKQLEQLRLESTMQSKIRVYESGRKEQDYDPDLPPELAAATGVRDVTTENANPAKLNIGQSGVMKGSGYVRPSLPTGRAIQVESGYGERLPSIDTRPPRNRDLDAIIEIVLQDTEDDGSSVGNCVQDQAEDGEPQREDFREDCVDELPRLEPEYFDGFPRDYNDRKKEIAGRMPFMNSSSVNLPNGDENLFFPQEEPFSCSGSRGPNPRPSGVNVSSSSEARQTQKKVQAQSPPTAIGELATVDNKKEESFESVEVRQGALLSSPMIKDTRESSVEDTEAEDESSRLEKEVDIDTVEKVDTLKDRRQILTSDVEQPLLDEVDDQEDSIAARSSDNSKARSSSNRDNQKQQEGFEEVVQDPQSARLDSIRQHPNENEKGLYIREHDGKQERERNHMIPRGREGSYPYRDRHPTSARLPTNMDGSDRQTHRDNSDMDWTERDDPYSRRIRNDEARKRDRAKVQENERSDKDVTLHSRTHFNNGSYRVPYVKDVGSRDSRHRERDDGLRIRYETMEGYNSKKRKDEEYLRREHIDKEEILHGYRENACRRRREGDLLDPRKRDDLKRSRDNFDDQYVARQKDETWVLKERVDRQREREEWHRMKQSHEEHIPKHEREEGRGSVRSGRRAEEKSLAGHVRDKFEVKSLDKEYQSKEAMRHIDQLKRRGRFQDESTHYKGRDDAYASGNQYNSEERRAGRERSSSRDHAANASDNRRANERKHNEGSGKSKEPDVNNLNSLGLSRRTQENVSGATSEKDLKSSSEAEHEIPGHRLSRKRQEDNSDEEQQDTQRGRSKLECWTSHKERDFSIGNKSSSTSKFKGTDKDNDIKPSEVGKTVNNHAKRFDVDNQHLLLTEGRDTVDADDKDADIKGSGDQQLDTVQRLKKRSERFKLPMPSEKEALAIKKLDNEPLPSVKSEIPMDSEVKHERPPRKRRWISN